MKSPLLDSGRSTPDLDTLRAIGEQCPAVRVTERLKFLLRGVNAIPASSRHFACDRRTMSGRACHGALEVPSPNTFAVPL